MLIVVIVMTACWVSAIAYVIGNVNADRKINANHHKLAMFAILLRSRDDAFPILSAEDRKQLNDLIDDYTRLNAQVDDE